MTGPLSRRRLCRAATATAIGLLGPRATAAHLPGALLIDRQAAAYDTYARCFNANVRKRPAAIALCRNETGVASALAYATERNLPVAIKSGGHSFTGFCLNDDGLVVDLAQMRGQRLAEGNFSCGPGWKLRELYELLLPQGRLLPAGSCGGVGVAGLTLGGGYGLFARQFGLTCDHLVGVRIATPDGAIRDSNQHPELLWACRGGGNGNFGVVTEFRFRTVTAPASLTAHRARARNLSPNRAANLLQRWMSLEPQLPDAAFSAFVLNGKTLTILITNTGAEAPLQPYLDALAPHCDQLNRGRPKSLADAIRPFYGRRGPLPFHNASGGFHRDFAALAPIATELATRVAATPGVIFQVNTLGGAIAAEPDAIGGAYPHRSARFLGELQAYWDRDTQAPARIRTITDLQNLLHKAGVKDHYRNYPDLAIRDWATAYYGESLIRLRVIKRQLDPDNRIRHPQSIQELPA